MRARACVRMRVFVCVLAFLYYIFLSWYVFYFVIYSLSDTFNFTCPPSRWQCQYRSCSRFPTTGSCSSSIAIFFNQYTRSTDKTCSTYFKVVQSDPFSFQTVQVSPLYSGLASSAAQWYSCLGLFVLFDSLRPLNNLSVMRDGSSWVEPVLS